MVDDEKFRPLEEYREYPVEEMEARASAFYEEMRRRRTVRQYARRPVPRAVIEDCLLAAGTAPSGANQQPWHFVVVEDAAVKKRIREAAEVEEEVFYGERAPQEWLDALEPFGTNEHKPYLEDAGRSEEHTSELQSRENLVCRLLLEKKKKRRRRCRK